MTMPRRTNETSGEDFTIDVAHAIREVYRSSTVAKVTTHADGMTVTLYDGSRFLITITAETR